MSLVNNLLDKLRGKRAADQRSAAEKFDQLVRDLADDQSPAVAYVDGVLQAAGKSPDELQSAVAALVTRRRQQAVAATEMDKRQAAIAASRELEAAKAEYARIVAEWPKRIEALKHAAMVATREYQEVQQIRNQVGASAPPWAAEIFVEARRQVGLLGQRIEAAKNELVVYEQDVRKAETAAREYRTPEHQAALTKAQAALATAQRQLAELREKREQAQAKVAEAERIKLAA